MKPLDYEAARLLPLVTDDDILRRARDLVGRANVRQLWLLFLDPGGVQLPELVPIGGLPSRPDDDHVESVVDLAQYLMRTTGATTLILVWERYASSQLGKVEAEWLRRLRAECEAQGVALRAVLLSHRSGVSWVARSDYELVSSSVEPAVQAG